LLVEDVEELKGEIKANAQRATSNAQWEVEGAYKIENLASPAAAADPPSCNYYFLRLKRLNLARLAKSLLSSFFFCARTDLFLGRLRAPPDGFNNPPDTRNRPGERFCPSRTGGSEPGNELSFFCGGTRVACELSYLQSTRLRQASARQAQRRLQK